ncbi:MAG: signal peptidase I [Promethearchaeota archaeon]
MSLNNKKESRKDKKPTSKKKIIIAVFLVSFAFLGSYLIYFILQIALNTNTPMVVVVSGSMEPTLYKGDLLFLQGTDPEDLKNGTIEDKKGDIIVYDARGLWAGAPDEPIVHRIVGKWHNESGWWFLTKGDANDAVDRAPVPEDRILGKVVGRIPYIGWVKIILTESGMLMPIIIILSALLLFSIISDIIHEDEEEEKEKEKLEKKRDGIPKIEDQKIKMLRKKEINEENDDFDF